MKPDLQEMKNWYLCQTEMGRFSKHNSFLDKRMVFEHNKNSYTISDYSTRGNWTTTAHSLRRYCDITGHVVASLPDILQLQIDSQENPDAFKFLAQMRADDLYRLFNADSKEVVGTTKSGITVLITAHGMSLPFSKETIAQAEIKRASLLHSYSFPVDETEFTNLLSGKCEQKESVKVYESYASFLAAADNLPRQYVVITTAKEERLDEERIELERLAENPRFVVRAGGKQRAQAYALFLRNINQRKEHDNPLFYNQMSSSDHPKEKIRSLLQEGTQEAKGFFLTVLHPDYRQIWQGTNNTLSTFLTSRVV